MSFVVSVLPLPLSPLRRRRFGQKEYEAGRQEPDLAAIMRSISRPDDDGLVLARVAQLQEGARSDAVNVRRQVVDLLELRRCIHINTQNWSEKSDFQIIQQKRKRQQKAVR